MADGIIFKQAATILNELCADAQGRTANISTTPRNLSEFISMAELTLSTGLDPVLKSISTVIGRTIFSARPYNGKYDFIQRDTDEFGYITRKLTPIFYDSATDQTEYDAMPADGNSVDQWKIKRPKTVQTCFVKANQWQVQEPTVFEEQLNVAFHDPAELLRFLAAQAIEVKNDIAQHGDAIARACITNMMGAIKNTNATCIINLLTEYNAKTALELTAQTVYQPQNWPAFCGFMAKRIMDISDEFTNRDELYHVNLDGIGGKILRNTPKDRQRFIMLEDFKSSISHMAMPFTFNKEFLDVVPNTTFSYWQSPRDKTRINVTPAQINTSGSFEAGAAVNMNNIVGMLYDVDAMYINIYKRSTRRTPVNAAAEYFNTFHHMAERWANDTTEKAVVFVLA